MPHWLLGADLALWEVCVLWGSCEGHEEQRVEPTGSPELSWESLLHSLPKKFPLVVECSFNLRKESRWDRD